MDREVQRCLNLARSWERLCPTKLATITRLSLNSRVCLVQVYSNGSKKTKKRKKEEEKDKPRTSEKYSNNYKFHSIFNKNNNRNELVRFSQRRQESRHDNESDWINTSSQYFMV